MDAFDADALIYAAAPGHPFGDRVRRLFPPQPIAHDAIGAGVGSVLLVPEVLTRPMRDGRTDEVTALAELLRRLDLRGVDQSMADLAAALGAKYRLRAADAVHLATAVDAGADRFITNSMADFSKSITEVDVTYPADLPD